MHQSHLKLSGVSLNHIEAQQEDFHQTDFGQEKRRSKTENMDEY